MRLAQLVAQYAAFRKSLGQDFESDARVLQSFSRSIGAEADISDVQADRVKAFLDGRGPLTRYWHRKHTILRGFYRYALSRGHIAASTLPVTIPKEPERFVAYIYSHEAAQLRIADLDLARAPDRGLSSVRIHGKGNKERRCPVWPQTAIELMPAIGGRQSGEHVFLNRYGRPLTRFGIHGLVQRYSKKITARFPSLGGKRVSPHCIRHYAGFRTIPGEESLG